MTPRPNAVGGLHEVCFGVPDLNAAAEYWRAFGYAPVANAALRKAEASVLYGVPSAVESLRLRHLDSDHGLVRLMRWEEPLGAGIGVAPLRAHGSRWVAQFVRRSLDIANHAAAARRAGAPLVDVTPSFIDLSAYNPQLYGGGQKPQPFRDRLPAVREYTLLQPLWRQAFLERFHYDSKLLGRIDDDAVLAASQVVNASMIVMSDDPDVYAFYSRALGLRAAPVQHIPWEQAMASRGVFDLRDGEEHWCYTFDEPRSGEAAATRRSGRLYLFRFPTSSALPDRQTVSQPGHLGCTLYTWRVRALHPFHAICVAAGCATADVQADEFGADAFRAVTPDGMTWVFQQATADEIESMTA